MWHEHVLEAERVHLVPINDGAMAFVPPPLPRYHATLPGSTIARLSRADDAIGRLAGRCGQGGFGENLVYTPLMRRDAIVSSRIEGTVASAQELLVAEHIDARGHTPAGEIRNYHRAMRHGLARLTSLPVSKRLMLELHSQLMLGVRGREQRPGEFRRIQVHIGNRPSDPITRARYIPPPAGQLGACLDNFEAYTNLGRGLQAVDPELIRIALAHYQFEAIHPFRDGNGRIGRLLVPLQLAASGRMPTPLLYISDYCEQHKPDYVDLLLHTSLSGDYMPWIDFFLEAIRVSAERGIRLADRLRELRDAYRSLVGSQRGASTNLLQLVDYLFSTSEALTTRTARQVLGGVSAQSARYSLGRLQELGVLSEAPWQGRGKLFYSSEIVDLMLEDAEEVGAA